MSFESPIDPLTIGECKPLNENSRKTIIRKVVNSINNLINEVYRNIEHLLNHSYYKVCERSIAIARNMSGTELIEIIS